MTIKTTENSVARRLIARALGLGYSIDLFDGEEYSVKGSTSMKEVCSKIHATDEEMITFHYRGGIIGRVHLIWGNSPEELIADCSVNSATEALLASLN